MQWNQDQTDRHKNKKENLSVFDNITQVTKKR